MKNLILSLVFAIMLSSCGRPNQVGFGDSAWNSSITSRSDSKSTSAAVTETLVSFEGNYDLIEMGNKKCGASIQIIKACGGYEITSNYSQSEKFCSVNKGEVATTEITSSEVTQKNNELKLINYLAYKSRPGRKQIHHKDDILMSKSLRLDSNGMLIISFDLSKKVSRCSYLRR